MAFQRLTAKAVNAALQRQVLAARGFGIYAGLLRHATDGAAHALRFLQHVEAGNPRGAGIWARQRVEDFYRRRFARAVGAEQRENGAGFDCEAEAVERANLTAIRLDKVAG